MFKLLVSFWRLFISWCTNANEKVAHRNSHGFHEINEILHAHKISSEMIINIDQKPLPFVLIIKYTLEKKDSSRVSLPMPDYWNLHNNYIW